MMSVGSNLSIFCVDVHMEPILPPPQSGRRKLMDPNQIPLSLHVYIIYGWAVMKRLCWPTAVEGRYINTLIEYNDDNKLKRLKW